MSLKTDIAAHATSVFLNTDHFAETAVRYIGGDEGDAENVTGLWKESDPEINAERGYDYHYKGEFHFAGTQTMTIYDALLVRSVRFEVERVSEVSSDGLKVAYCVRRTGNTRGAKRSRGY